MIEIDHASYCHKIPPNGEYRIKLHSLGPNFLESIKKAGEPIKLQVVLLPGFFSAAPKNDSDNTPAKMHASRRIFMSEWNRCYGTNRFIVGKSNVLDLKL